MLRALMAYRQYCAERCAPAATLKIVGSILQDIAVSVENLLRKIKMANKPNKHLPVFRRTKEQIAKDNKNFEARKNKLFDE